MKPSPILNSTNEEEGVATKYQINQSRLCLAFIKLPTMI